MRMCGATAWERELIGCRDIVGYGHNGTVSYVDRLDYPFPAIRFLATEPYIQVKDVEYILPVHRSSSFIIS